MVYVLENLTLVGKHNLNVPTFFQPKVEITCRVYVLGD